MPQKPDMKEINIEILAGADRKATLHRGKKVFLSLVALAAVAGAGLAAYPLVAGQALAARFSVNKMTCPACVETIEEVAGGISGVLTARANLAAQEVSVVYRKRQTRPEVIRKRIAKAGYPARFDGVFDPDLKKAQGAVVAYVNGEPLFSSDLKRPAAWIGTESHTSPLADQFFFAAGWRILLTAADEHAIVAQPHTINQKIDQELKRRGKKGRIARESPMEKLLEISGSELRLRQAMAQRIAVRHLVRSLLPASEEAGGEKVERVLPRLGELFRAARVRILDPAVREELLKTFGAAEWRSFWPHMINGKTTLKAVLAQ